MDLQRVIESLAQQGFPCERAEVRDDGTYPVLRTDEFVVKLFGERQLDHDTELAAYRMLSQASEIPTPTLLAQGRLDNCDYLVLSRMPGQAVLETRLTDDERQRLARQLGHTIRRVHELPMTHRAGRLGRDWMREHGSTAAQRHRAWRTLPNHLIEQIDDYLTTPSGRVLVHADLAVEHVFVQHGELTGIIDWGGAEATDPHYELPVLHLDLFYTDKRRLEAFLDSYGWPDDDFVRRAMSATLCGEFDTFELLVNVRPDIALNDFSTLDALADELWRI